MTPTPLLDFWQKPVGAGEPIAVLATTFALEPDFFEQNCLARFLEVSSVNEDTGTIDDIVACVELHELLQKTRVTVLADRSAPVQRTSLLWDLLGCKVNTGLLHAKVSLLLWENATRVILGSANLTAAGYRRQIELGLAADLGDQCLFPRDVLTAIANELESYLLLVPGYAAAVPVFTRAANTIALFRQRILLLPAKSTGVRVAFAPTTDTTGPLDVLSGVWNGPQPLYATHLSPFWDSGDQSALNQVRRLLTGRPADKRSQHVAVVLGPAGQTSFSQYLTDVVDTVQELNTGDTELRLLHAKCLLIESQQWVAALVGSSNHTKAGLGLSSGRRHREMNVWIGAARNTREGKALLALIQLGKTVSVEAEQIEPKDEDETELPTLPSCFGLCRVTKSADKASWLLQIGICPTDDMPDTWGIAVTAGENPSVTRAQWEESGAPESTSIVVTQETLPMYVLVKFNGSEIPWAVIADDRHNLPALPALSSLRVQHLLDALATGRSLAQVLREELERKEAIANAGVLGGIYLDPLRRFENQGALLRRGRALAVALASMQRRIGRQVVTADTLRAHLTSPLGPEFVAKKVVEAFEAGQQTRAESLFTIAEIALAVGRVNWLHVLEHVDRTQGLEIVNDTLKILEVLCLRIGGDPVEIASYAHRAIEEARRCLLT